MKVWTVEIDNDRYDKSDEVTYYTDVAGVYSSKEAAKEAAQKVITGVTLEWCIDDPDDPDHAEAANLFWDDEPAWFNGNPVFCISVRVYELDAVEIPNIVIEE